MFILCMHVHNIHAYDIYALYFFFTLTEYLTNFANTCTLAKS